VKEGKTAIRHRQRRRNVLQPRPHAQRTPVSRPARTTNASRVVCGAQPPAGCLRRTRSRPARAEHRGSRAEEECRWYACSSVKGGAFAGRIGTRVNAAGSSARRQCCKDSSHAAKRWRRRSQQRQAQTQEGRDAYVTGTTNQLTYEPCRRRSKRHAHVIRMFNAVCRPENNGRKRRSCVTKNNRVRRR